MLKKIGGGCLSLIGLAVVAIIVFAVIVGIAGSGSDDEGVDTGSDSSTVNPSADAEATDEPKADKPEPAAPAAMRVRAGKILKEFDENEAAADAKYKDKTLRVSGVVEKVDTDLFDGEKYIIQVGNGSDFQFVFVNCNDISASVAAKVKKGTQVSVQGEFDDGGNLGVELKDCALITQADS